MRIGIFDSGLGGLTGYRALRELLPAHDLIYFGDNARVPYGTKSGEVICRFALQDVRFLLSQKVEAVLVACGTVSSNALSLLEETFPLPFVGVVEPAARRAAEIASAGNGKILVLGTAATVGSGAYEKAIRKLDPSLQVESVACPMFVPLAENGFTQKGDVAATEIAKRYLAPYEAFAPDAMILGCTHFPLLTEILTDVLPAPVKVSAGEEAAKAMAETALALSATAGTGKDLFFTSDDPESFRKNAATFLGRPITAEIKRIEIETF
jgi:glutamate racemase